MIIKSNNYYLSSSQNKRSPLRIQKDRHWAFTSNIIMEERRISAEVKGHFLRLYSLAICDDNFSPSEWKMLYEFADQRGISKLELDKILLETTGPLAIPESLEKRIEYLYDFALLIWADGEVSTEERSTLVKFCHTFEFMPENINSLTDYLLDSVKNGLSKTSILAELKND